MPSFQCDECDHAPFDTPTGLRMHKIRKHTKQKPGAYKRKKEKAGEVPVTKRRYTRKHLGVSLPDAIAALKVKRDALNETIAILEAML